ncbi:MAG: hypothetical protein VXX11_03185 [Planctomycetota bacterium]|nr:hypothetical protein [Planctomycetota bacterium]
MKKDLFDDCFDKRASPTEFKEVFCNRCRNPVCVHAQWGQDKFTARNAMQEAKLFNPSFADTSNPKYASLRQRDFPSLFREAIRLHRADEIGDWSLPEDNVVLAPIAAESASGESQDLVEKAVASLKKGSRDQVEEPETAPEAPETQSAGSTVSDSEILEENLARKSHQNLTPKSKENADQSPSESETRRPTKQGASEKNTFFDDGEMVGGDYPRQDFDKPKTKKQRVVDSWGSSSKIHEPGTTIKMGKKK